MTRSPYEVEYMPETGTRRTVGFDSLYDATQAAKELHRGHGGVTLVVAASGARFFVCGQGFVAERGIAANSAR